MKTFTLAALLVGGASAGPTCKARCGTQVGFTSGVGPDLFISYDGTTLTVPQTCREERCGALETALAKADADNAALLARFEKAEHEQLAASKAQQAETQALRALVDTLSAELRDMQTSHGAALRKMTAKHAADTAAASAASDAADKALADEMEKMEIRLTPTPAPTPPPTPAPTCNHEGKTYAVGDEITVDATCAVGCAVSHPCLQKPLGGLNAAEKDACFGTGGKRHTMQSYDHGEGIVSHTYEFQRNKKCSSEFTDWGRPGESFGRTTPGFYADAILSSTSGHAPGHGARAVQWGKFQDRYWLCRGDGGSGSSDWEFAKIVGGPDAVPTQVIERCMDYSLERHSPEQCIRHGKKKRTPSGQVFQLLRGKQCNGATIKSTFTDSFYGPFVEYKNKGPMANARKSNAEQYFDGKCPLTVSGLDAAKKRCRQEKFCGGFHRKTDATPDEYCLNLGSRRAYPGDSSPQIGHWGHTFPTETAYDLWDRQAYSLQDMLRMCEATDGCDCINIHKGRSQDPDHRWSMHQSTDVGGGGHNDHDWAVFKRDEDPDEPDMVAQPGVTLTKKCTAEFPGAVGAFVTTKTVSGSGTCIPDCH